MYRRAFGCVFLLSVSVCLADEPSVAIRVGGGVLRMQAKIFVLPTYPPESFRAKVEGVAAVEVTVDTNGTVASVDVLSSPDSLTRASIVSALKRWRFHPFKYNGAVVRASGRLVFYFKITDGEPLVVDATAERLTAVPRK